MPETSVKRFHNGQRVKVINPEHLLFEEFGTVVRLRRADDQAWVNMDREIPREIRCFPLNDPAGRGNHLLLAPEDCATIEGLS